MSLKEFFGFGGYQRPAEGYLSWQHLLFVSSLMAVMVLCAVWFSRRTKGLDAAGKNRVLKGAAILIDGVEVFKIVMLSIAGENPMHWTSELPLFLCSVQLIALPLAAFSHGRIREAALDFVVIFGLLGAVMGTYFAGNNYACYPVISIDNVASGITHSIAGFGSLYVLLSGLRSMKKRNIPLTVGILLGFCTAAYVANGILDYNYMFLVRGDGTPYDILYNLVGGHPVLYPLGVVALFVVYITLYYGVYFLLTKRKKTPVAQ